MVILTCCTHYGQAFARGFLDLEGFLTPILASLVSKNKAATDMLDVTSDAGRQGSMFKVPPWQCPTRLLCLLSARLAALGSSALPG